LGVFPSSTGIIALQFAYCNLQTALNLKTKKSNKKAIIMNYKRKFVLA